MQKTIKTYTREFKVEAVKLAISSKKPLTQISRDLGIADSTLHQWCKQYGEQGEQAFPGSGHQTAQEEEIRHLKRENELLRQERDILKKLMSGVRTRPPSFFQESNSKALKGSAGSFPAGSYPAVLLHF